MPHDTVDVISITGPTHNSLIIHHQELLNREMTGYADVIFHKIWRRRQEYVWIHEFCKHAGVNFIALVLASSIVQWQWHIIYRNLLSLNSTSKMTSWYAQLISWHQGCLEGLAVEVIIHIYSHVVW